MEEQNSNTQTASEANSQAAVGPNPAELQAKIAELEKQSEGRLRDLQNERAKRQELEARVNPALSNTQPDTTQDELGKVLKPYIAPVMARAERAEAFMAETLRDKALEHLSSKTGKSKDAVINDKDLDNKLTDIVKRFALRGNVYDLSVRAYEILELENLKAKEAERQRSVSAGASASLPTGNVVPATVGSKEYSEEDFNSLPMVDYEKLSSSGSFHQNKEGKIVFTPNK